MYCIIDTLKTLILQFSKIIHMVLLAVRMSTLSCYFNPHSHCSAPFWTPSALGTHSLAVPWSTWPIANQWRKLWPKLSELRASNAHTKCCFELADLARWKHYQDLANFFSGCHFKCTTNYFLFRHTKPRYKCCQ
jgi:hypothetical protein